MQCNQYSKRQKQLSRLNPNIHFLKIETQDITIREVQCHISSCFNNYYQWASSQFSAILYSTSNGTIKSTAFPYCALQELLVWWFLHYVRQI